jgi:hypothetical protein
MSELKINEIPDKKIREKRLRTQRDEGRPTEDDIVREHFGPRGEKKDNPNRLPLEGKHETGLAHRMVTQCQLPRGSGIESVWKRFTMQWRSQTWLLLSVLTIALLLLAFGIWPRR